MQSFLTFITEGHNDPAIFKAVFMAGGPGSGKSFIASKSAFRALGLQSIASDEAFEHQLKKNGLTLSAEDIASEEGQLLRGKAKRHTDIKHKGFMKGRLGFAIDGTGHEFEKINRTKIKLEKLGYETAMVFVNTDLQTALERNRKRPRSLRDELVVEYWNKVQKNLGAFQAIFNENMFIIDNSNDSDVDINTTVLYKKIRAWVQREPSRYNATKWLKAKRPE